MYRLQIIPINLKNISHEFFSLQVPNLSSDTMSELELNELLLEVKIPLSATKDIFTIHAPNSLFWSDEKKRFIRIMYYVSDLQDSVLEIIELLQKNFCLDIFIDRPLQNGFFNFLNDLRIHTANVRFVVIEKTSEIQAEKSIFEFIPAVFKSRIYFLYLPSVSNNQLIPRAAEVMSRIEVRRAECYDNKETLKILSITNNQVFADEPHKKIFYLNPNQDNYFKYLEQIRLSGATDDSDMISNFDFYLLKSDLKLKKLKNYFLSLFLSFAWKTRHIYWSCEHLVTYGVPKIISYLAKGYWSILSGFGFIRVKFIKLFWALYSLIANIGIFIQNIPGKVYKICVENYWVSRKILGSVFKILNAMYWQLRKTLSFTFNLIVQLGWKSKTFLSIFFINSYWSFRKMISHSLNLTVQFSWKIKSILSISGVRLYWMLRKSISNLFNFCVQSYWKIRASKYLQPFFKIYWFISFQFNKRIVSLFKKKI